MFWIRFENDVQKEVCRSAKYKDNHGTGWLEAPEGFNPKVHSATLNEGVITLQPKTSLSRDEEIQAAQNALLVYNDDFDIGLDNYRETFRYNLDSTVTNDDINADGDVIKIQWFRAGVLAIQEDRTYTRTETGVEPMEVQTLKKDTVLTFYRKNGTTKIKNLPTRVYNTKQRKSRDEKSRTNLLEKTRELTGQKIYIDLAMAGKLAEVPAALDEAKLIFGVLNKEINEYKFERLNFPLVEGINNYTQTQYITREVLDFILSKIDREFYIKI